MTRKGAPFQGTIGEVKTASSVASSQLSETWACESGDAKTETQDAPVTSNRAVTAECNCRARNIEPPSLEPHLLVQNHGKIIAVAFINSGLKAGDKSRSKIRQKGGL